MASKVKRGHPERAGHKVRSGQQGERGFEGPPGPQGTPGKLPMVKEPAPSSNAVSLCWRRGRP